MANDRRIVVTPSAFYKCRCLIGTTAALRSKSYGYSD
jgi:hypothetical protein